MACENEHGWRFITVCLALREYLPDDEARAAAAESVVALWEAHDDGDEAVSRFLGTLSVPTVTRYAGRDVDDRAQQRDNPEWLHRRVVGEDPGRR